MFTNQNYHMYGCYVFRVSVLMKFVHHHSVYTYIFKEIVFYFKIGNFFTHHNLLLNLFKFKMVATCYNLKMFLISCKQYTYIHRYSYIHIWYGVYISFTITIRSLHCHGNSSYSFRVLTWESCLHLIRFHFI